MLGPRALHPPHRLVRSLWRADECRLGAGIRGDEGEHGRIPDAQPLGRAGSPRKPRTSGSTTTWHGSPSNKLATSTGDPFDVPGRQQEVRILERHGGQWRIAGCFMIGSPVEYVDDPLLRVDETATVVWMNGAAEEELKHHHAPTPRAAAGSRRVARAGNPAAEGRDQVDGWAQALCPAAGGAVGSYRQRVRCAADHPRRPGRGEQRDLSGYVADGGLVLVSFNDQQSTEQRLRGRGGNSAASRRRRCGCWRG